MILQPFTDLADEAAKENGDEDEASYGRREDESEDESSPPPAGNTEGEGLKLNKTQMKEARGTASPEQINVKVCTSCGCFAQVERGGSWRSLKCSWKSPRRTSRSSEEKWQRTGDS